MMSLKDEIRQARKNLAKADFEAHAHKPHSERFEELAKAANDDDLKAAYRAQAEEYRKIEEMEKVKDATGTPVNCDDAEYIRLRALEDGPTLGQRLNWRLSAISSAIAFLVCAAGTPFVWLYAHIDGVAIITFIATVLWCFVFGVHYGIPLTAILGILATFISMTIGAGISNGYNCKSAGDRIGLVFMIGLVLSLVGVLTFGRSPVDEQYIAVEKRGQEILEVADARGSAIRSPNIFRGEEIVWYSERMIGCFENESWSRKIEIKGLKATLNVTCEKDLKLDYFQTLCTEAEVMACRPDLVKKIDKVIDEALTAGDIDLVVVIAKVQSVPNDLFGLKNVKASITIDPITVPDPLKK